MCRLLFYYVKLTYSNRKRRNKCALSVYVQNSIVGRIVYGYRPALRRAQGNEPVLCYGYRSSSSQRSPSLLAFCSAHFSIRALFFFISARQERLVCVTYRGCVRSLTLCVWCICARAMEVKADCYMPDRQSVVTAAVTTTRHGSIPSPSSSSPALNSPPSYWDCSHEL